MIGVLFRTTPPMSKDDAAGYWRDRLPHGTPQLLQTIAESPIGTGLLRNQYLAQEVEKIRRSQEHDNHTMEKQLQVIDSLEKQLGNSASPAPIKRKSSREPSLLTAYRSYRKQQKSSRDSRSIYS